MHIFVWPTTNFQIFYRTWRNTNSLVLLYMVSMHFMHFVTAIFSSVICILYSQSVGRSWLFVNWLPLTYQLQHENLPLMHTHDVCWVWIWKKLLSFRVVCADKIVWIHRASSNKPKTINTIYFVWSFHFLCYSVCSITCDEYWFQFWYCIFLRFAPFFTNRRRPSRKSLW